MDSFHRVYLQTEHRRYDRQRGCWHVRSCSKDSNTQCCITINALHLDFDES